MKVAIEIDVQPEETLVSALERYCAEVRFNQHRETVRGQIPAPQRVWLPGNVLVTVKRGRGFDEYSNHPPIKIDTFGDPNKWIELTFSRVDGRPFGGACEAAADAAADFAERLGASMTRADD